MTLHHFVTYNTGVYYDYVQRTLALAPDRSAETLADLMGLRALLSRARIRFHGVLPIDEYETLLATRDAGRHAAVVRVFSGYRVLHHFAVCWHANAVEEFGPSMGWHDIPFGRNDDGGNLF